MVKNDCNSDEKRLVSRRDALKTFITAAAGVSSYSAFSGITAAASSDGKTTDDFAADFGPVNRDQSRWSYWYQADGNGRNGDYERLPDFDPNENQWETDANTWDIPYVGPERVHPGESGVVVLPSWLAPESATADIDFAFDHLDGDSSNGVAWWVEHRDGSGGLVSTLDSGTLGPGESTSGTASSVSVSGGDRINFVVGPDGSNGRDHVGVDGSVTYTSSDTAAPTAPQALSAETVTDEWVEIEWQDASDSGRGLDHYNVYVDGSLHRQTAKSRDRVYRLSPGTSYDIDVTAVDEVGNESDASSTLSVTTANSSSGTSYYVDADTGSDSNAGTSPSSAWASLGQINSRTFDAGDEILIRAGTEYQNQKLHPSGSGSDGDPIVVDRYGTGGRPTIHAGGVDDAVLFENQEHWVLADLEITNKGSSRSGGRTGVRVQLQDFDGTAGGFELYNLFVHDVNGSNDKSTGGGKAINWKANGDVSNKCRFGSMLVEGCRALRTDRSGLIGDTDFNSFDSDRYLSPNVVVRENLLEDIGGDGIKMDGCDAGVCEHNTVDRARQRADDHAVAIWTYSCDDTVTRFCEASRTKGTKDAQGFDCDFQSRNTLFEFNYSHDNDGGFMLFATYGDYGGDGGTNENPTVRYNISENDDARSFRLSGPCEGALIYNNLVYVESGMSVKAVEEDSWSGVPKDATFYNNVWYVDGSADFALESDTDNTFDANAYVGSGSFTDRPSDSNAVTSGAGLFSVNSGDDGFDTLDGYRIQRSSNLIDAANNTPDAPTADFWGDPVPSDGPDNIGPDAWAGDSDGPVAYYAFEAEDAGRLPNRTYRDNYGRVEGGVTTDVAGKFGEAYEFDGSSGYVKIGRVAPELASESLSMACWVRTTDSKGVILGVNATSVTRIWFLVDNGTFTCWDGSSAYLCSTAVNDDAWHHVAATVDAGTGDGTLYVDGSQEKTFSTNLSLAPDDRYTIGAEYDGQSLSDFLGGRIDELRVYDRVLSGSEVSKLYNQ